MMTPGRVLAGRYRLEHPLGQGGMGAVWVATHTGIGQRVALKVLLDASDPALVERLRREAFAAASLAHPKIVRCIDFAPASGGDPPLLVMELLAGTSLGQRIVRKGPLPTAAAIHIAVQMLDALSAAHAARILHRDVKPGNVVVLDGGDEERPAIKLVDFGIAMLMDDESRHTITGTMMGTPAYMAPEQLRGQKASPATDVYAVGVCLYEMLAGVRPFAGRGGELIADVLRGEPPALPVDEDLAKIVQRAMHANHDMRYASAAEMKGALEALRAVPSSAPPAPPLPAAVPRSRKGVVFAGALVATVVVTSIAAIAIMKKPRAEAPRTVDVVASTPVTSVPVDPAPSESASTPPTASVAASSASARSSRTVLSFCSVNGFPTCAAPVWACECWLGHGQLKPSSDPNASMVWPSPGPAKNGTPCQGFAYFSDGRIEPATGTFACSAACDDATRRASWRQAVPGTPCTGYQHDKLESGTWQPVTRPR